MPYLSLPNFNYDSGPRRIQSGPNHEGYVVLYSGVQSTGPDEGIVVAGAPLSGTITQGAWDYDANWRYVPSTLQTQSGGLDPTPYNVSGALDTYDGVRIYTRNTVAGVQIASAIGPQPGSTVNRPEKYMYFGGAAPDNQNYSPYNTPDANSAAEGKTGGGVTHRTFESSLLTNVLGSQGTSDRSQWRYHQPVYCKTYTETRRSEVPGLMSTPLRAVYRGGSTSYNYNYGGELSANRGGLDQLPPPPGGGPAISLRVDPSVVYEDEGISLVYYFELSEPLGFVTTSYYLVSGTATNGVDYTGPSDTGSVTIAPGTLSTSFIVTPINDAIYEPLETVIVSISGTFCNGASIPAIPGSATGVILSSTPTISVSVSPASVVENAGIPLIYTFTLSDVSTLDTTVNYTLSGTATNGVDYTGSAITGTRTIPAGELTAVVVITPVADAINEGTETVVVTIDSAVIAGVLLQADPESATGAITEFNPFAYAYVDAEFVRQWGGPALPFTATNYAGRVATSSINGFSINIAAAGLSFFLSPAGQSALWACTGTVYQTESRTGQAGLLEIDRESSTGVLSTLFQGVVTTLLSSGSFPVTQATIETTFRFYDSSSGPIVATWAGYRFN